MSPRLNCTTRQLHTRLITKAGRRADEVMLLVRSSVYAETVDTTGIVGSSHFSQL